MNAFHGNKTDEPVAVYSILCECEPWPSKDDMASLLVDAGISAHARRFSVVVDHCCGIAFKCYGGDLGAPEVQCLPSALSELVSAVQKISGALRSSGLRHYFEIQDLDERPIHYVHHRWPAGEGQPAGV